MDCSCGHKAVITLQHGSLCRNHFLHYFEEKVFHTIKKYHLITRDDRLCVAASGGKDSLTILSLAKKYLRQNQQGNTLFALAIDEGIAGYREHTLADLRAFCEKQEIPLTVISYEQEFGCSLDQAHPRINRETNKKPCTICGVWRRYLLNKYARQAGATKLVTGHNLDDEAQVILMNVFKANTALAAQLGPLSGIQEHASFVQRVKPLYFCTEKETRLYALLQNFQVQFAECPYAEGGYRAFIRDLLNTMEEQYPGTKQGVIHSFLALLPLLKKHREHQGSLSLCRSCHEPARQEYCNACLLVAQLDHDKAIPKTTL